ncbi:PilZ domain-containing protein [Actinoplanes sp. GCM10030250]|uniref:PilZ domain-containing protein n=1 Tax=Actinoplanes sp. GCM10030250 TaxID=3273376 RepID=UPI0036142410
MNGTVEQQFAVAGLPEAGTPVFLALGEGANFRSRLEAVEDGTFCVAAPLETAGPAAMKAGHEFQIFWAPPRTRVVLPVRLVEITDTMPFRWRLAPIGEPQVSNRREFVRGGGGAAVRLTAAEEERASEADGMLLDISEGGLRCRISQTLPVRVGDDMEAVVWLGSGEVRITGKVHTVRPEDDGTGQQLILIFRTQEVVAQMIRQYIINWEMAERRRARERGE